MIWTCFILIIFKLIKLAFTTLPLEFANSLPSLLSFSYVSQHQDETNIIHSSNTKYCTRLRNIRYSQDNSNHCTDAPGTSSILSDTSIKKMVSPSSTLRSTLKSINH